MKKYFKKTLLILPIISAGFAAGWEYADKLTQANTGLDDSLLKNLKIFTVDFRCHGANNLRSAADKHPKLDSFRAAMLTYVINGENEINSKVFADIVKKSSSAAENGKSMISEYFDNGQEIWEAVNAGYKSKKGKRKLAQNANGLNNLWGSYVKPKFISGKLGDPTNSGQFGQSPSIQAMAMHIALDTGLNELMNAVGKNNLFIVPDDELDDAAVNKNVADVSRDQQLKMSERLDDVNRDQQLKMSKHLDDIKIKSKIELQSSLGVDIGSNEAVINKYLKLLEQKAKKLIDDQKKQIEEIAQKAEAKKLEQKVEELIDDQKEQIKIIEREIEAKKLEQKAKKLIDDQKEQIKIIEQKAEAKLFNDEKPENLEYQKLEKNLEVFMPLDDDVLFEIIDAKFDESFCINDDDYTGVKIDFSKAADSQTIEKLAKIVTEEKIKDIFDNFKNEQLVASVDFIDSWGAKYGGIVARKIRENVKAKKIALKGEKKKKFFNSYKKIASAK